MTMAGLGSVRISEQWRVIARAEQRLVGLAALAVASVWPLAQAHAQEPAAPEPSAAAASAEEEFEQAREAYHSGQFEPALQLLQQLYDETGSPNAHLFLARCHRELGNLIEAYQHMTLTVSEASAKTGEEERYAATRDAAARELAELSARVGLVTVLLTEQPKDVDVTVAGRSVASNRLGSPIPVDPGQVSVRVTAPGFEPVVRTLDVAAGENKALAISLSAKPPDEPAAPEPPAPAPKPPEASPEQPAPWVRTAGFFVAAVGVAGILTFAAAGATAEGKYSTLERECGDSRCTDPDMEDVVDSGRTFDTVANVGLIVGAAGLAIGGTMILLGWPSEGATRAARGSKTGSVALHVSPSNAMLRCGAVF
jgi:hypothetical protein